MNVSKIAGEAAVEEILAGVRAGTLRVTAHDHNPVEKLTSRGWTYVRSYHPQTIKAVRRRLVWTRDGLTGYYVLPAAEVAA